MQHPVQITFRNIEPSAALENRIRDLAARLERFSAQIIRCQAVIEAPHHRHHEQGALFEFRIQITVPGKEIVIASTHGNDPAHENAYVALQYAFRTARRALQDYEKIRRQGGRKHSQPRLQSFEHSPTTYS
jgi:ribosome-associated translation inhibitor RaiA